MTLDTRSGPAGNPAGGARPPGAPTARSVAADSQPVITGAGLLLRPLVPDDAPLVARHAGDRRVALMTTSLPFPMTAEAAADYVARARAPDRIEDVWAIDGTPGGAAPFLGVVSLKPIDRGQSEIGYWVAPAYWNRGHASRAVAALLEANPHDNSSVVACVFQDNPASARVLTANGFECLGEAEAFSLSRGCHVPTWTYLKRMSAGAAAEDRRRRTG